MSLLVIASIYEESSICIGYRLFDDESEMLRDVSQKSLIKGLYNGVKVGNVEVRDGELVGTNGSLERYAKVNNLAFQNVNMPLVILGKINGGYRVVDYLGHIRNVREAELIRYAEQIGIANGKVVNKDNKKFISAISGEYGEVNVRIKKRYVVLSFVHGVNDLETCVTCNYFDTVTNKTYGRVVIKREFEKLGYSDELSEPQIVKTDVGYIEVHKEVYPVREDCVIRNKSYTGSWWDVEILIGLSAKPGYYLAVNRRSGAKNEYSVYDLLKLKQDGYNILCDIEYTENSIIIKSATDIHSYDKYSTIRILKEHKKNIGNTRSKLNLIGSVGIEIDSIGRLVKVEEPPGTDLVIPDCVNEIALGAFSRKHSYYKSLKVGSNLKKINYRCSVLNIRIDSVETTSFEIIKAIARKKSEFKVKRLTYNGYGVDSNILLKLLSNVEEQVTINGKTGLSRELAIELLDRAFKEKNIQKYLKSEYILDRGGYNEIDIRKKPTLLNYANRRNNAEITYTNIYYSGQIGVAVADLKGLVKKITKYCEYKDIGQKYMDFIDKILEEIKSRDKEFINSLKIEFKGKYTHYNCKYDGLGDVAEADIDKYATVYKFAECSDNIGNNYIVKVAKTYILKSQCKGKIYDTPWLYSIIQIGSDLHNAIEAYENNQL